LIPLRQKLENIRTKHGVLWEVIERDYMLSWLLAGISSDPKLHDTLVFKGGTALKKCYFGDYRFSEDLDFSSRGAYLHCDDLEDAIERVCETTTELAEEYSPIEFTSKRYTEKRPHPGEQEAFIIRARFPWHRQFLAKVMIEITVDEPILMPPVSKPILHEYEEEMNYEIMTYTLEEIVAEKLRAILQQQERLEQRGWSRSRARDYYDIWNIFKSFSDDLDMNLIPELLINKCTVRDIEISGPEQFFEKTTLDFVESTWEEWLGHLVRELPAFDTVINDLRLSLNLLLTT
jgi:hypothetical protein